MLHKTTKRTLGQRVFATSVALLLSGTAFMGVMAPAAHAQGGSTGNISTAAQGTINVYKHANPGGTLVSGNGTEQNAGGAPLSGVNFSLYKVADVDLATVAGWDAVAKGGLQNQLVEPQLNNSTAPTSVTLNGVQHALTPVKTTATDTAGLAAFSGLVPALYVVVEGDDTGNNNITSKSKPFYVALPINNAGNWQYSVNVFPKNVVAVGPQKEVVTDTRTDGEAGTDGTMSWTVTQKIPVYDKTTPLQSFVISDDLTKAGVHTGTADSVVISVGGVNLQATADYTAVLQNNKLVVTFTSAGLLKLTSGETLTMKYKTTENVGEFTNNVETVVNGKSIGTAKKTAYLGKITVTKTDRENAKALDGAEFKICAVAQDGSNNGVDCKAVNGAPLVTGADNDGVNGVDGSGKISFDKLALGKYVLVETKAPAGYVLPANPVTAVTLNETTTTVENAITNEKQALPGLPLTGAQGKVLLTISGAGLLLLAFGFIIIARRRRENEEAQA